VSVVRSTIAKNTDNNRNENTREMGMRFWPCVIVLSLAACSMPDRVKQLEVADQQDKQRLAAMEQQLATVTQERDALAKQVVQMDGRLVGVERKTAGLVTQTGRIEREIKEAGKVAGAKRTTLAPQETFVPIFANQSRHNARVVISHQGWQESTTPDAAIVELLVRPAGGKATPRAALMSETPTPAPRAALPPERPARPTETLAAATRAAMPAETALSMQASAMPASAMPASAVPAAAAATETALPIPAPTMSPPAATAASAASASAAETVEAPRPLDLTRTGETKVVAVTCGSELVARTTATAVLDVLVRYDTEDCQR
jgi:hypothetical protein